MCRKRNFCLISASNHFNDHKIKIKRFKVFTKKRQHANTLAMNVTGWRIIPGMGSLVPFKFRSLFFLFIVFFWFICIFNHALESIFGREEGVLASNLVAPCFAIRIYPFFCILNQYNDNSCVKCNYSTRHKIEFISKTSQSMSLARIPSHLY